MVTQEATRTSSQPQLRGPSIFVVDDETLIGEVVEAILKLEGFEPTFFASPTDAYNAFLDADRKPDLLLTDFIMTPMNGMELIERCKAVTPHLKTLLYSGNVGEEILQFYQTRPNAFLSKPFMPKQLVAIVNEVLGPSVGNVALQV